jgi:hypothetical protein
MYTLREADLQNNALLSGYLGSVTYYVAVHFITSFEFDHFQWIGSELTKQISVVIGEKNG